MKFYKKSKLQINLNEYNIDNSTRQSSSLSGVYKNIIRYKKFLSDNLSEIGLSILAKNVLNDNESLRCIGANSTTHMGVRDYANFLFHTSAITGKMTLTQYKQSGMFVDTYEKYNNSRPSSFKTYIDNNIKMTIKVACHESRRESIMPTFGWAPRSDDSEYS